MSTRAGGLIWSGLNLISSANGHYCWSADAITSKENAGVFASKHAWTEREVHCGPSEFWCKQSSPVSWSAPTDSSLKRTPRRSPSPPSPWIREQKAADCCCKKRAETEIENGSSCFHRWSPPDNLVCGSNFFRSLSHPAWDLIRSPVLASHSFVSFFLLFVERRMLPEASITLVKSQKRTLQD